MYEHHLKLTIFIFKFVVQQINDIHDNYCHMLLTTPQYK